MINKKILRDRFRCCLHCSSWRCGPSLFCPICEHELWNVHSSFEDFEVSPGNIRGSALFSWVPDQDRKLSKLLMAIKGGEIPETLRFYAESFIQRQPEEFLPSKTVFVPCPSSLKDRRHSQELARAFSEILHFPVFDGLKQEGHLGPQKRKSKKERQAGQMSFTGDLSDKYVIFIDDVVTTGGTALSAAKAIGPCLSFSVWCLAHRRQLAAEGLF